MNKHRSEHTRAQQLLLPQCAKSSPYIVRSEWMCSSAGYVSGNVRTNVSPLCRRSTTKCAHGARMHASSHTHMAAFNVSAWTERNIWKKSGTNCATNLWCHHPHETTSFVNSFTSNTMCLSRLSHHTPSDSCALCQLYYNGAVLLVHTVISTLRQSHLSTTFCIYFLKFSVTIAAAT